MAADESQRPFLLEDRKMDKFPLVIAGTGHRPPRLGLSYDADSNMILTAFARASLERLLKGEIAISEVVSGMAQGWDQCLAHAAIQLKIPVVAALPFEGQESKWPEQGRHRYRCLLKRASHVEVVGKASSKKAYIDRDHWMVNRAAMADSHGGVGSVLALWDGGAYGGTHETVQYANRQKVQVTNVWDSWQKFLDALPG
jgi:uncharacterized phage-like protein YoqJ